MGQSEGSSWKETHTWDVVVMGRLGGGAWRVVLMGKLGRGGVFVGSGTRSMGGRSWSVVIMRLVCVIMRCGPGLVSGRSKVIVVVRRWVVSMRMWVGTRRVGR